MNNLCTRHDRNALSTDSKICLAHTRHRSQFQPLSKNNMIGKGGYGTIYKSALDNDVAVKQFSLHETINNVELVDFNAIALRELVYGRHMISKQCCTETVHLGYSSKHFYLYMRRKGINLKQWLELLEKENQSKQLPVYLPLILGSVLQALALMHQQHLIHGDIKLHNVLIDPESLEVSLIDFGGLVLNRFLHSQPLSTVTNRAPECFPTLVEEESTICTSSIFHSSNDIFAFGILLLELLTGKFPYLADAKTNLRLIYDLARQQNSDNSRSVGETGTTSSQSSLPISSEDELCLLNCISSEFYDCLKSMLRFDFRRRPSAMQLLHKLNLCRPIIDIRNEVHSQIPSKGSNAEATPMLNLTVIDDEATKFLTRNSSNSDSIDLPDRVTSFASSSMCWKKFGELPSFLWNSDYIRHQPVNSSWELRKSCIDSLFNYCKINRSLPILSLTIYLFDQYLSVKQVALSLWLSLIYVCLVLANDITEYNHCTLSNIHAHLRKQQFKVHDGAHDKVHGSFLQGQTLLHDQRNVPSIILLQNLYLQILSDTQFNIYFLMFDYRILYQRDSTGYRRLFLDENLQGWFYTPTNLMDTKKLEVRQVDYSELAIDYNLVFQICADESLFLHLSQPDLMKQYEQLEIKHKQQLFTSEQNGKRSAVALPEGTEVNCQSIKRAKSNSNPT